MRKLFIPFFLGMAACGGGSSSSSSGGPSGTVAGHSFSSAEVVAVQVGATACNLPGVPFSIQATALAIGLASYTGQCSDLSTPFCTVHRSAENVTLVIANAAPFGAPAAIGPGTYALSGDFTPNISASPTLAAAAGVATDASCVATTATPAGGSTVRIDSVSATRVTGHLDVTFSDGGRLQGDFSAPVCAGVTPDICAVAQSQGACSTTPQCR